MKWWLGYSGLLLIACQEFYTPIGFVLLVLVAHMDDHDVYNVSVISIQVGSSGLVLISLKQGFEFESCEWRKICYERALLLLGPTIASLQ